MKIELPDHMLNAAHQAVADAFRYIRVFGPPSTLHDMFQTHLQSCPKQPYGDREEEECCPLCAQPIFPIHARWQEPASVGEITLRCESGHQVELLLEPMPTVRVWIMAKADAPRAQNSDLSPSKTAQERTMKNRNKDGRYRPAAIIPAKQGYKLLMPGNSERGEPIGFVAQPILAWLWDGEYCWPRPVTISGAWWNAKKKDMPWNILTVRALYPYAYSPTG